MFQKSYIVFKVYPGTNVSEKEKAFCEMHLEPSLHSVVEQIQTDAMTRGFLLR